MKFDDQGTAEAVERRMAHVRRKMEQMILYWDEQTQGYHKGPDGIVIGPDGRRITIRPLPKDDPKKFKTSEDLLSETSQLPASDSLPQRYDLMNGAGDRGSRSGTPGGSQSRNSLQPLAEQLSQLNQSEAVTPSYVTEVNQSATPSYYMPASHLQRSSPSVGDAGWQRRSAASPSLRHPPSQDNQHQQALPMRDYPTQSYQSPHVSNTSQTPDGIHRASPYMYPSLDRPVQQTPLSREYTPTNNQSPYDRRSYPAQDQYDYSAPGQTAGQDRWPQAKSELLAELNSTPDLGRKSYDDYTWLEILKEIEQVS